MEGKVKVAVAGLVAILVAGVVVYALFGAQLFGQKGVTGLGVEVFYKDGTTKLYDVSLAQVSSLQIIDPNSNKAISKLRVIFSARLVFEGETRSWEAHGDIRVSVFSATQKQRGVTSFQIVGSGSSWANGETKEVGSYEITSNTIEGWLEGDGQYTITFTLNATIYVYLPGGSRASATGSASTHWDCIKETSPTQQYQIKSFQVTVSSAPLY